MRVRIDAGRCTGHAMCAVHAPEVYQLDEIGHCAADGVVVAPADVEAARAGAMACPEQAITLDD